MLRMIVFVLFILVVLLSSAWAVLALWYQLPWPAPLRAGVCTGWAILALMAVWLVWSGRAWPGAGLYILMFAVLMIWWGRLDPSHDRQWADDLAHITTGQVQGDIVTLENVRNFTWRTQEDYDVRWETRRFDLSRLRSVDLITSEWGMPGIAHILVSFGFDDGEFITFTVEIRRERNESFSAIGGFFKQFELNVLATDENDAVRVRSNVRGEATHIYRVTMPETAMRDLFMAYVDEANELAGEARFYHTVTANCTIIVYNMMRRIVDGLPLDHRLLLSARLPEYVKDVGGLEDEPLQELRARGDFTERARAIEDGEDFSQVIRRGVPGWTDQP
ncbi:DUF4105 domain-containing protein [Halopseudomonas nanhaiensis]|uniref:Lnb N-terminal periplasmic domain-containing protein n=1 Tax=Halopseudomonas nanhaiensis TaxID=2830842 RepID=UPI001CBAE2C6|nr:DUF4105 domain-containing protein [Halopseudomonas nanhaiensis]UAW99836.1 DUF4105 domain-containing protein [Halopseudomonas nanhaiensis]